MIKKGIISVNYDNVTFTTLISGNFFSKNLLYNTIMKNNVAYAVTTVCFTRIVDNLKYLDYVNMF